MKSDSYSSCQLTSVPSEKLDLSLDFQSEVDYDFYEKNVNASPSCRYLELDSPFNYGQNRKWGNVGNEQDVSLWQDFNPLWYQRNDIGYGNDRVYYDRGVVTSTAAPGYGGVPLAINPNNPFNNVQLSYGGVTPTLSTADRLPVSSNGK